MLRPVPLGAVIGSVGANDSDAGSENSRLTYYLRNGRLADVFDVRSRSGEIRTKVVLGHDRARRYLLEVIAADGGVPALSATATVCCLFILLHHMRARPKFTYIVLKFIL